MLIIPIEKTPEELAEYDPKRKKMLPYILAVVVYLMWS